jgi:hypothetical protein
MVGKIVFPLIICWDNKHDNNRDGKIKYGRHFA